jgi:hypothetical protein
MHDEQPKSHYWPYIRTPITLVGCGGIGSVLTLLIPKSGTLHVTLYDDDVVEPRNLQAQHFPESDIGLSKVASVQAGMLALRPDLIVKAHRRRFTAQDTIDGIAIMGVDSNQSRKLVLEGVKKSGKKVPLLLDGRLRRAAPHYFEVFAIDPQHAEMVAEYEQWLADTPSAIANEPRPRELSAHTSVMLSGIVGLLLARWSTGERLPWRTTFDGTVPHLESYYF